MSQIVNHNLYEEQNQIPTQMGFIPFPTNQTFPSLGCNNQSLKALSSMASSLTSESADSTSNLTQTLLSSANPQKSSREYLTPSFGGTQFLSLQRSSVNPW
jgi:hypothetical protein